MQNEIVNQLESTYDNKIGMIRDKILASDSLDDTTYNASLATLDQDSKPIET